MLDSLLENLTKNGITYFTKICANAEDIPFPDDFFDCVLTFNAIHHFNLREFLRESTRILKIGGYILIYTRLRDQNSRNIWGRYFPMFHHKENRLYTLSKLVRTIETMPNLHLKTVEYYKYGRRSTLKALLELARDHHYSTFSLYSSQEFEEATKEFSSNIKIKFQDDKKVHWFDENILLVINKK